MRVRREELPGSDALHRLPGAEKAVEFDCGPTGNVIVTGGRSSPRGAALAMVKDVLGLCAGERSPGLG